MKTFNSSTKFMVILDLVGLVAQNLFASLLVGSASVVFDCCVESFGVHILRGLEDNTVL